MFIGVAAQPLGLLIIALVGGRVRGFYVLEIAEDNHRAEAMD